MVRITESNIRPSVGGSTQATAFQASDIGKSIERLGKTGQAIFQQLDTKRKQSDLIAFKGEYNTAMAKGTTALRKDIINMDKNGDIMNEDGTPTGVNIQDRLDELQKMRGEFEQRAEGLDLRNDAVNYLSNVRSQDHLKLSLQVEKQKDKLRKKDSIDSIGNASELFVNSLSSGAVTNESIATVNDMFNDSKAVLGTEQYTKLRRNFGEKSYKAYIDSVTHYGRNPASEKALMEIGEEVPSWQKERFTKAIEKADRAFQVAKGLELSRQPEKLQKATSDMNAYINSKESIIDSASSALKARFQNLPNVDNEQLFKQNQIALSKASLMESVNLGSDLFAPMVDKDGNPTEAGIAAKSYLEETADRLVKEGSITKEERNKLVEEGFRDAAALRQSELSNVAPQAKATLIARYSTRVKNAFSLGNEHEGVSAMEQIYTENNIDDDERSYVTDEFVEKSKRDFKEIRSIDGTTGRLESSEILKKALKFGDKWDNVAGALVQNKIVAPYAVYAGHLKDDAGFLQEISSASQNRVNAMAMLKMTEEDFKKSAFKTEIMTKVNELQIPQSGDNMYLRGAGDIIENLALKYATDRNSGVFGDSEGAIERAANEFNSRFEVVKSGTTGGMIYSKNQLRANGINDPEPLQALGKNPTISLDYLSKKGINLDYGTILQSIKKDPNLAEYAQTIEPILNAPAGKVAAQARILDLMEDNLMVTSAPDDNSTIRVMMNTNRGPIPLFFNQNGKTVTGDIKLNEVVSAVGTYRKVSEEQRMTNSEMNRQKFRLAQMKLAAQSANRQDVAEELEAKIQELEAESGNN